MNTFQKASATWNKLFVVLMKAPILDKAIGKSTGVLTYTGRKSGKEISLPVSYKRKGDDLVVGVMMPDKKNWWKNFSGDGNRMSFNISGVEHPGFAVTTRDAKGSLTVKITLD